MPRITLVAAAALAAIALSAPVATAMPLGARQSDMHASTVQKPAVPQLCSRPSTCAQDLRSADARDPARAATDPLATERYYSSYGTPDSSVALAQERYLSSYGQPASLTAPQSPAPSDETPWLPIALSIAVTLLLVAVSATQLRRLRFRRRRPIRSAV